MNHNVKIAVAVNGILIFCHCLVLAGCFVILLPSMSRLSILQHLQDGHIQSPSLDLNSLMLGKEVF